MISTLPTQQVLQVFAARAAARVQAGLDAAAAAATAEPRQAYRNFLIIAAGAGDCAGAGASTAPAAVVPDEVVAAMAQHLSKDGYAYVARAGQKEMEDDAAGIRYLPLRRNRLPSFGEMTAVIVIGDPAWAELAVATYPEADVFVM